MNDMSKVEAMKAAREARDRVGSSRGSSTAAVEAAMKRYLSAEQYHELTEREATSVGEEEQSDQD